MEFGMLALESFKISKDLQTFWVLSNELHSLDLSKGSFPTLILNQYYRSLPKKSP